MFTQNILSKIKNSTCLVTGGAGFIGSNIVKSLLDLNAKKVIVFDDLSTGFLNNITEFNSNDRFEFIKESITDYDACLKALKNVDVVFQLAALGSVPRSIDNPRDSNLVNVSGFLNVLSAAKENNIKRIVYSSSSSVYGDDKTSPKLENKTGNPLSPYAVTKKANELYAHTFANIYNLEIVGLRYFNVFGPKQNVKGAYAAVIPIFISNLLNGKTSYINGDGEISRDFTHVDNVVYANILAAFSNISFKHEVFNIAMGNQLSLKGLYQKLEENIKSGLKPVHRTARVGDIQSSLADISKAKNQLGFNPVKSVDQGISETIGWYKRTINK